MFQKFPENWIRLVNNLLWFTDIFVPRFVLFDKPDTGKMTNLLKQHQIKFPIVCKPVIAHGSSDAHKVLSINYSNSQKYKQKYKNKDRKIEKNNFNS